MGNRRAFWAALQRDLLPIARTKHGPKVLTPNAERESKRVHPFRGGVGGSAPNRESGGQGPLSGIPAAALDVAQGEAFLIQSKGTVHIPAVSMEHFKGRIAAVPEDSLLRVVAQRLPGAGFDIWTSAVLQIPGCGEGVVPMEGQLIPLNHAAPAS